MPDAYPGPAASNKAARTSGRRMGLLKMVHAVMVRARPSTVLREAVRPVPTDRCLTLQVDVRGDTFRVVDAMAGHVNVRASSLMACGMGEADADDQCRGDDDGAHGFPRVDWGTASSA